MNCGWRAQLPKLIMPSRDAKLDTRGTSRESSGSNWKQSNYEDKEIYNDFVKQQFHDDDTPLDFRRTDTYTYKREDKTRQRMDVWILRSSVVNDAWDVDVELTLENEPGKIDFTMTSDLTEDDLEALMVEEWPFLGDNEDGDLDLDVDLGGYCNGGFNFKFTTREHGKMPKIQVSTKVQSSRHKQLRIYVDHEFTNGVLTQFIPGSVSAVPHHQPQVVVTANGQRSSCDKNCDYRWAADHTIELTSVKCELDSGKHGSKLVKGVRMEFGVDLKAYKGSLDYMKIMVSGYKANCNIPSIDTFVDGKALVKCTIMYVKKTSKHEFKLVIADVGTATYNGREVFTSDRQVQVGSPTTESKYGGVVVTMNERHLETGQLYLVRIHGVETECDSGAVAPTPMVESDV